MYMSASPNNLNSSPVRYGWILLYKTIINSTSSSTTTNKVLVSKFWVDYASSTYLLE